MPGGRQGACLLRVRGLNASLLFSLDRLFREDERLAQCSLSLQHIFIRVTKGIMFVLLQSLKIKFCSSFQIELLWEVVLFKFVKSTYFSTYNIWFNPHKIICKIIWIFLPRELPAQLLFGLNHFKGRNSFYIKVFLLIQFIQLQTKINFILWRNIDYVEMWFSFMG